MNLEHHEKWLNTKRTIAAQFQHYRAIRVAMFNLEKIDDFFYDYPKHLLQLVEDQLIPTIEREDVPLIKEICEHIEAERLKWEYKSNEC